MRMWTLKTTFEQTTRDVAMSAAIVAPLLVLSAGVLSGCTASYMIHSNPEGAAVYYQDPSGKNPKLFLGTTPLTYNKAALPTNQAFLLTIQKEGFAPQDVPMAATDESKTVVNVKMKTDPSASMSKEINNVLKRLFKAQRLIYEKKYHAAIIELDEIIKDRPEIAQTYVMKGTCYYLLNEMKSATSAWKLALKLDAENPDLLHFLDENKIDVKEVGITR